MRDTEDSAYTPELTGDRDVSIESTSNSQLLVNLTIPAPPMAHRLRDGRGGRPISVDPVRHDGRVGHGAISATFDAGSASPGTVRPGSAGPARRSRSERPDTPAVGSGCALTESATGVRAPAEFCTRPPCPNHPDNSGVSLLPNRVGPVTLGNMSPPLDAMPAYSPEPRLSVAPARTLAPDSVHDLRGDPVEELRYPNAAALVFAGVPGAGKSTALRLFFGATAEAETAPHGPGGVLVLDSHHARNRWRRKLGWLPYPLWRPVVHVAHYAGIRAALRDAPGPVVIHDCATFGWARAMIRRWTAGFERELHLVMVDVPPLDAMAGQHARGRRVNGVSFRLHVRRWQRLIDSVTAMDPDAVRSASVVVVDRSAVNAIRRITFGG